MKLSGLNAIVTGGSQGFGRHIVEAFLDEGANVLFCARNAADVTRAQSELTARVRPGQRLLGTTCDVGNPDQVAALFRAADWGGWNVVVNNAGVYGPIGPTDEIPWSEWLQALQINLNGTLLVCQQAMRAMKPRRAGKIINISGGGATNPMPRFASYAATKAAVVRLTETLAEELREYSIDVNAVAPGALRTRLTDQVLAAGAARAGEAFFAKNKKWAEEGAVDPRLGAGLCVWLASAASDGITGKLLSAQWDPWKDVLTGKRDALTKSDIYTLRRIVPEDRGQKWS
ncbi:MAG TPA: SDR family oxidoreductase [Opitutaceae bacterium]|nr:SDR family oxidoreductase [Opitutaceae bacterium]